MSRLARSDPALKIGKVISGANAQLADPGLNKPPSVVLSVPPVPVITMVGKNAARAAPILALLASSVSSASMMSGRRVNRSEGRPAGMSARIR